MIEFNKNDLFLITGANSGIGKAIAHKIIKLGGTVIGVGRNSEKLNIAKNESEHPDHYIAVQKDLAIDIEFLDKWIDEITSSFGKLKGLILSAGMQYTMPISADKINNAKSLFDINFFSNVAIIKGFAKKSNNIGNGSSIVAISSFTAELGLGGISIYSASKAALNSFVRSAAVELAKSKIRINSISAGHVQTTLLSDSKGFSKIFLEKISGRYPLGLGTPEDIANLTCFLLSDQSRWINGSNIIIDGGAHINFL